MGEPGVDRPIWVRGDPPEEAGEPLVLDGRDEASIAAAMKTLKARARKVLVPGTRFEIRQVTRDAGIKKPFLSWYWSAEMECREQWKTGPVGLDVVAGVIIVERCVA